MENLGQRIRMVRQGESRASFSRRLGISPASLQRYEGGERQPDTEFLEHLMADKNLCRDWLLLGKGPMHPVPHADEFVTGEMADMSAILEDTSTQHSDFIENKKNKMADMSAILDLQQKLLDALQEQNNLLRENAHLRLQLERRDMRIRDLEREVAELREARKGAAAYGSGVAGSAG